MTTSLDTPRRPRARHTVWIVAGILVLVVVVATPFAVQAVNASVTAALPPAAVSSTHSTTSYTSLKVSWPRVQNATQYQVAFASDKQMTDVVHVATSSSTTVSLGGLAEGRDYYYKVRAFSAWGSEGHATKVEAARTKQKPVGTPANVTVHTRSETSLTVSWGAAQLAKEYTVQLLAGKKDTKPIASYGPYTKTSVVLNHVPANSNHYIVVTASRPGQASASSNPVIAYALPGQPTKPSVIASSPLGITLLWGAAGNAARYTVERSSSSTFATVEKTYSVPSAYTRTAINDLPADETAYFRVRAVNGTAASMPSSVVKAHRTAVKSLNVRVGTFNVLNLRYDKTAAPWLIRRESVGNIINSAKLDVVGLQEASASALSGANGLTQIDDIVTLTSPHLTRSTAGARGTQLLYNAKKYKALRAGTIDLPLFTDDTPRVAVWQELQDRKTKTSFIVLNAHLTNAPGADRDAVRQRQAETIMKNLPKFNPKSLPLVITGDLNSYDGRTAVTPMSVFATHGYLETGLTAATTTNAQMNSLDGFFDGVVVERDTGIKLDHVIAGARIGVLHYEVSNGAADASGTPLVTASDHRMIYSDLRIEVPAKKTKKK